MDLLILAVLLGGWCFLHSYAISLHVTKYLKNRLGNAYRFYRLFYNIFAVISIIPVWLYMQSLPGDNILVWRGNMVYVMYVLYVLALLLFFLGARTFHIGQFLGMTQIKRASSHAVLSGENNISSHGILGVVRHPWYAGGLLLLWARSLNIPELVAAVVLSLYLIIGAWLEERKLVVEFGDQYRQYQQQVSMFFPWKWLLKHIYTKKGL